MNKTRSIPVISLLALLVHACTGGPDPASQRAAFLTAERAFAHGDREQYEALAAQLHDYPLYPYLEYRRLREQLDSAAPASVARFLADHADTPLAERLRGAWLDRLAREERWHEYLRFHVADDSLQRRCRYLQGLLLSGARESALAQVEPLWLRGKSLPAACDPLLAAWKEAGRQTEDLVWKRIALAMEAGQTRLAGYLGKSLPAGEQVWLERWQALYREPRLVLDPASLPGTHPFRNRMLAQGISRLAPTDPGRAADAWDRQAASGDLLAPSTRRVSAALGFALAAEGDPRGLGYLDRIPAREDNLEVQERRLMVALKRQDWDRVARWIADMPDGERKSDHWLYWQARAEEIGGNAEKAHALFVAAAAARSLWGFLAAERVGHAYRIDGRPTPADPRRIRDIERSAAAGRMRELEVLGRAPELRREWRWLIRDMDREDLMAAALFAQRAGWPVRAIFTLAKSGYWDDLGLRFPLLYQDIVEDQAMATGLAPSWIFAVLRHESTFDPRALSPAAARGLMQLMPATAREVARSLGLQSPARDQLFDPSLNIALGSGYLARMQRRFDGNQVLATAAYNAGPARVERWIPARQIAADLWIATIPWRETRTYVRRVLAYRLIYDHRLGGPIEPLQPLLRPIGAEQAMDAHAIFSPIARLRRAATARRPHAWTIPAQAG